MRLDPIGEHRRRGAVEGTLFLLHLLLFLSSPAIATELSPGVDLQTVEHRGRTSRVVTVDLEQASLTLHGQDPARGGSNRSPSQLETWLSARGEQLLVSTNAGIFGKNLRPLGLHVEGGIQHRPVERRSGSGSHRDSPAQTRTVMQKTGA